MTKILLLYLNFCWFRCGLFKFDLFSFWGYSTVIIISSDFILSNNNNNNKKIIKIFTKLNENSNTEKKGYKV